MTPEEIIVDHVEPGPRAGERFISEEWTIECMKAYAQQEACRFSEWLLENCDPCIDDGRAWMYEGQGFSSEQLFIKYKQEGV